MVAVAFRSYIPPRIGRSTPDDVFEYNWQEGLTHVLIRDNCGGIRVTPSIAVYVDGTCRNDGTIYARAGMDVYFGEGSPYNFHYEFGPGPQTSQRAEIQAAVLSLDRVREMMVKGEIEPETIVLVSGSAYLVYAMTGWIESWRDNGWTDSYGRFLINWRDFQELEALIEELEEVCGVYVKFWHVDRSWNEGADGEARMAVGGPFE